MAYGNQFKTDELGGLSFSATYTSEQYPLGTIAVQQADELGATTVEGTIIGNSGVDTTLDFALLQGDRTWMFIKAGSTIGAGDLVAPNAYGTPFVGKPDAADNSVVQQLLGVADNEIASGSYGWVCVRGTCVVAGTGSIILGSKLDSHGSTGTAGQVTVSTSTDSTVVGYAMEALSGTKSGFAQAYIDVT